MKAILVALPLRVGPLSYLPPHGQGVRLGHRVAVPFRKGVRVGLVVGEAPSDHGHALRPAIGYLDDAPFLDAEGVRRLHRAAAFLLAPLGQVVADFLPFLEAPLLHRVRLLPGARPEGLPANWRRRLAGWTPAEEVPGELLEALRLGEVLEEAVTEAVPTRRVLVPRRRPDRGLGPRARAALTTLWALGEAPSQAELARKAGVGTGAVRALIQKGYAGLEERPALPPEPPFTPDPVEPVALPVVPSRIHGGRFAERMALLAGLMQKGRVLALFPEAALLARARPLFPQAIAFSGEVPATLRRRLWRDRKRSVLGTAQALFFPGPFDRVVVVEEASGAHKLRAGSHAFLPALVEALDLKPVYLGAAPSVHALRHAGKDRGQPVLLKPPRVRGIALDKTRERRALAGRTLALTGQALARGHQVLVLAARKGYAARLHCKSCGFEPACPNCALPLRYYKRGTGGELVCHQCGHREPAPPVCPACGSEWLLARGPGLDWLADRLARRFPDYPVGRMSADLEAGTAFAAENRPGILVATTRVVRARPLEKLALVVLPWVEGFLPEADFTAPERFFQLLWQLADLAPGRSPFFVLEAYNPDHPAIRSFLAADPLAFPEAEAALREAVGYPPYTRMVKIELSHRDAAVVREAAGRLGAALAERARPEEVLGPAPAPIPRIRGRHLWHLILRGQTPRIAELLRALPDPAPARMRIDPDPIGFTGLLE